MNTKTVNKVYVNGAKPMGFLGWLALTFIVLKLCGVIAWSWWWVLAPIWMPLAVMAVVLLGVGLVALASFLIVFVWAKWGK